MYKMTDSESSPGNNILHLPSLESDSLELLPMFLSKFPYLITLIYLLKISSFYNKGKAPA